MAPCVGAAPVLQVSHAITCSASSLCARAAQAAATTAAQVIKAGRQSILFAYVRAMRGHGVIPADKPSSPAVHLLPLLLAFSPAGGATINLHREASSVRTDTQG